MSSEYPVRRSRRRPFSPLQRSGSDHDNRLGHAASSHASTFTPSSSFSSSPSSPSSSFSSSFLSRQHSGFSSLSSSSNSLTSHHANRPQSSIHTSEHYSSSALNTDASPHTPSNRPFRASSPQNSTASLSFSLTLPQIGFGPPPRTTSPEQSSSIDGFSTHDKSKVYKHATSLKSTGNKSYTSQQERQQESPVRGDEYVYVKERRRLGEHPSLSAYRSPPQVTVPPPPSAHTSSNQIPAPTSRTDTAPIPKTSQNSVSQTTYSSSTEPQQVPVPASRTITARSHQDSMSQTSDSSAQSQPMPAPTSRTITARSHQDSTSQTSDSSAQSQANPAPISRTIAARSHQDSMSQTSDSSAQSQPMPAPTSRTITARSHQDSTSQTSDSPTESQANPAPISRTIAARSHQDSTSQTSDSSAPSQPTPAPTSRTLNARSRNTPKDSTSHTSDLSSNPKRTNSNTNVVIGSKKTDATTQTYQDSMTQTIDSPSDFDCSLSSNDFLDVAKTEDPEYVADAFAKDPNLQWSVDQCGNNLFHGGCEVGNISLIRYLLKKLPDGDVERLLGSFNRQGLKPFHVAVSSGMCHIIKLLSKFSPQLAQETTREGSTAVHLAVQANCRAALTFLVSVLDQDFIWSRDASGATPLHLACVEGSAALVLDLLRVPGASVNVLDGQGQSCLHIAVILGHFKLCQTLLSLEYPMTAAVHQPGRRRNTALHYACSNHQYNIVKLLLEHGANAQARNKMKLTPAEVACDELVSMMIDYQEQYFPREGQGGGGPISKFSLTTDESEFDYESESDYSNSNSEYESDDSDSDDDVEEEGIGMMEEGTEHHSACYNAGRPHRGVPCSNIDDDILFEMIKSGCNIPELESVIGSAQSGLKRNVNLIRDNESGGTLLHLAAKIGYLDTVQFLVEGAGAEVDCQDDHGMTPLHCAVEFHHIQVSRYLVQGCGARLDIRDHDGDLALDVAVAEHADDIARFLRDEASIPPSQRWQVGMSRSTSSVQYPIDIGLSI